MQLLAHVLGLGLGLGLFIVPFIVRHMAAQQMLDLVANATAGPCFKVRVRVFH
jgi:C4-dicarboxylate-specific signal transduction histidine kinase